MKKKYTIVYTWQNIGLVDIEASNLDEAREIADHLAEDAYDPTEIQSIYEIEPLLDTVEVLQIQLGEGE